jgi:hypothetical protein
VCADGFSAPTPTASCTYTQVDTHYEATLTWSDFSVTSIQVFNGSSLIAQTELRHPDRNGSLALSLNVAPTSAQIAGSKLGVKVPCNLTP